jgi:type VI secretion system protein ImpH
MSPENRRKNTSLVASLLRNPHAYSFFQAVRILERAGQLENRAASLGRRMGAAGTVGGFSPPSQELVRFKANQSFRFPESEIHAIERDSQNPQSRRWNLRVTFMGLTGSMGVMPFHYTELILQRIKLQDEALVRFLDLFNHRTISLFYRAATKYRLPLQYERAKVAPEPARKIDLHTQALLSLVGIGTKHLQNRLQIRDESLLFYAGLFAQQLRSASGLKQILADYFGVPVQIREFVGQWEELMPDARSRLSTRAAPKGQNVQLGRSLVFGRKAWFAQGKIRICLGPLNREQFYRFAPGTRSLKALNEMVRLYVGAEKDYDFVIEVNRKDIPQKIALRKDAKPLMGWNTWLSSTGRPREGSSETLKITVPANRLK